MWTLLTLITWLFTALEHSASYPKLSMRRVGSAIQQSRFAGTITVPSDKGVILAHSLSSAHNDRWPSPTQGGQSRPGGKIARYVDKTFFSLGRFYQIIVFVDFCHNVGRLFCHVLTAQNHFDLHYYRLTLRDNHFTLASCTGLKRMSNYKLLGCTFYWY